MMEPVESKREKKRWSYGLKVRSDRSMTFAEFG